MTRVENEKTRADEHGKAAGNDTAEAAELLDVMSPALLDDAVDLRADQSALARMSQWQLIRRAFARHKLAVIA
ncbi:MAG TPA: hypothetical protein VNL70_09700, partial [Tepidisphaeraceae bacterium]|nr:hypothetical protein [Tepidisphaeraceae bacterium]